MCVVESSSELVLEISAEVFFGGFATNAAWHEARIRVFKVLRVVTSGMWHACATGWGSGV